MRCRPDGNQGHAGALTGRLRRLPENQAWTWEHQALTRAPADRWSTARLAAPFAARSAAPCCAAARPDSCAAEVRSMRARMRERPGTRTRDGRSTSSKDAAVFADIEFMVQYSVLRWAATIRISLTGPTISASWRPWNGHRLLPGDRRKTSRKPTSLRAGLSPQRAAWSNSRRSGRQTCSMSGTRQGTVGAAAGGLGARRGSGAITPIRADAPHPRGVAWRRWMTVTAP